MKEKLHTTEDELKKTREYLAKEKVKSDIVAEFYEQRKHTGEMDHYYRTTLKVTSSSACKECGDLKADIKQLHQDLRKLEMSYLSQLTNQCKINNDNIVSKRHACREGYICHLNCLFEVKACLSDNKLSACYICELLFLFLSLT